MLYKCDICAYETPINSNYNKHLKTDKHILKSIQEDENTKSILDVASDVALKATSATSHVALKLHIRGNDKLTYFTNNDKQKKEYKCQHCESKFSHHSSFYRHRRICPNNNIIIKHKSVEELEKNLTEMQKKLENEKKLRELESQMKEILIKQVEDLKDDKQFTKKVTENTTKIADKIADRSMSALNYVIKNMNDAPILKALPNEDIKKMLDYGDKTDTYMVESVVYAFQEKHATKLLGDAIIKYYKTDNPKQQSLWNTDVSRLTYLVRLTVHDEDDWIVDKQGIRTNRIIIEPFLNYIRDKILFVVKNFHKIEKLKALNEIDFLRNATCFINEIDNGTIKDDIIKYIAPYLALERIEHRKS